MLMSSLASCCQELCLVSGDSRVCLAEEVQRRNLGASKINVVRQFGNCRGFFSRQRRVSSVYTASGQPRSPGRWNPHYNIKFNLITIFAILIIITISIIITIILVLIANTITTPIIFIIIIIIIITIVISTTLRIWQKA
ncbi:unnamed protein product [Arctogadus glacialis]